MVIVSKWLHSSSIHSVDRSASPRISGSTTYFCYRRALPRELRDTRNP